MTKQELDNLIEDILLSDWDSAKTKVLDFARLMCDKQKEICAENTNEIIGNYNSHGIQECDESVLNSPYPDELQ